MLLRAAYRLARLGVEVVPRGISVWVGKRMADACFLIDRPGRRAVIANLTHVLSSTGRDTSSRKGRREIRRLARETFENFAVHIIDFMRLPMVLTDIRIGFLRLEHFERFRSALSMGKGLISVTAHIGNWEVGAAATASEGLPIHTTALQFSDEGVNRFFAGLRESGGIRLLRPGHVARQCFRVLNSGEMLALVADRDIDGSGFPVTLFGMEVKIPRGPAEIAARTGAPVVPAFCMQEPSGCFVLRVEEAIEVDEGLPIDERVGRINREMALVFERYIARYPSQWFAFYKVWP